MNPAPSVMHAYTTAHVICCRNQLLRSIPLSKLYVSLRCAATPHQNHPHFTGNTPVWILFPSAGLNHVFGCPWFCLQSGNMMGSLPGR
mmetsp:Transcript_62610/g.130111  ORF Transcript_62610/g.130111 Transcript_62610/m.130111 type:complete len:88 (+) Transcript_62610:250-513(+)